MPCRDEPVRDLPLPQAAARRETPAGGAASKPDDDPFPPGATLNEAAARLVLGVAGAYFALGAVFAVVFLARGLARLDAAAAHSTRGFRVVIVPGIVALWPYLLVRWARGANGPPVERNAHRLAATAAARYRP